MNDSVRLAVKVVVACVCVYALLTLMAHYLPAVASIADSLRGKMVR